jgi:hypothetical protein
MAFAVIGCVAAGSAGAEEPAAGTIVPEGEMTEFCQNAAAERFRVQLDAITTNPPISRDGKLLVLGTVDDEGTDRDGGFDCRFEANGAYIDVIGAPGD